MPIVIVPPAMQGPTFGKGKVEVSATTVRDAIAAVETKHPGFGRQVFADGGGTHRFVSLFRNGSILRDAELDKTVDETDEIEILAALAGG